MILPQENTMKLDLSLRTKYKNQSQMDYDHHSKWQN